MRNHRATKLIFELSRSGRKGVALPQSDVPEQPAMDVQFLASDPPALPELAEPDVIRHFTNLSTLNMSVDTHF